MKFFAYNEKLDVQLKYVQRRIRKLMNGEVASQLIRAGMNYEKLFGVSLVHLRQLSEEIKISSDLADRLWHRKIRETMILATMVAQRENITDKQLVEWAESINNLELAEQMAFNLLGKRRDSGLVIEKWMLHSKFYVRYSALMALGWQFRFDSQSAEGIVKSNLSTIEALATDETICRAIVHCLKMSGRFSDELRPVVQQIAEAWVKNEALHLQRAGEDIMFELNGVKGK